MGGAGGVVPVYSANITASTRRGTIRVPGLVQDTRYYCLISVFVSDVAGGVYILTTPTNISVNTLPLVPPRPITPTVLTTPTSRGEPHTIAIDLTVFKATLSKVGSVRIAVLKLGSSPTVPSGSPDLLYQSEQSFTTYEVAHSNQGSGLSSKPYFAVEFSGDDIMDTFVLGGGANDTSSNKRRETPAGFTNGPLSDDSYYIVFIRVYSFSQYGPQYDIYTSTSFTSPVKPVPGTSPTEGSTAGGREGGGNVGLAVGLVFFILLLVAAAVAVLVVIFLFWR